MGDGSSGRSDAKGKGRATPNNGMLALDLEHAEGGLGAPNGGSSAFQQMQLVEQQVRLTPRSSAQASRWVILMCLSRLMQDSYIQSRSTAIESIETTIAELGQIFNQLAHMVAEQRETVQRIDADTLDIASNVGGAQRELLKYYASISSNRWLMLKVFGVLIVFVSLPTPKFVHDLLRDVRLTAALSVFDFYLSIMMNDRLWLRPAAAVYTHAHAHYAPRTTLKYTSFARIQDVTR
jgi:syntaxin 5